MEKEITLVIMAAGIGSRFGQKIKQLEPVGPDGELIIDYSVYDAVRAGFNHIVFVILVFRFSSYSSIFFISFPIRSAAARCFESGYSVMKL